MPEPTAVGLRSSGGYSDPAGDLAVKAPADQLRAIARESDDGRAGATLNRRHQSGQSLAQLHTGQVGVEILDQDCDSVRSRVRDLREQFFVGLGGSEYC